MRRINITDCGGAPDTYIVQVKFLIDGRLVTFTSNPLDNSKPIELARFGDIEKIFPVHYFIERVTVMVENSDLCNVTVEN